MSSDSTTRWPLLEERAPFAPASPGEKPRPRRLPRSVWLLTGLAFLCGGLVSAAAFSIGWRHQAQRDTAARAALAAETARVHKLQQRTNALRNSLAAARGAEARAVAAAQALAATGARVAGEAAASSNDASSISSRAGTVTASATRIASELKTLDTYLTTTPEGQLDPGYVASQAAYLSQQLTRLQSDAGGLADSVASFEAAARKLSRDAAALKRR